MNKCYFCEKIYDTKTLKNMSQEDRKKLCQKEWELYCVITHNTEDDTFNIWSECDDDYYSGEVLEINFCPECGRKINPKYKTII